MMLVSSARGLVVMLVSSTRVLVVMLVDFHNFVQGAVACSH